jgi:sugar/nucleoside kinase (ribokinase family)
LIVTPDNEYWFRKLPIESINATGDGDAFAAPLTVALLEKRSWEVPPLLKTTKPGAQAGLPTRKQVLVLLS